MTTSPNIAIKHINALMEQKEVVANQAFDALANRMTTTATIDLTGSSEPFTVPSATANAAHFLQFTNAPAARTIQIPLDHTLSGESPTTLQGRYCFINASGEELTLKAVAGTETIRLADGETIDVRFDGLELYPVAAAVRSGTRGTMAFHPFVRNLPSASLLIMRVALTEPVRFPAGMALSLANAGTAAALSSTFSLEKNGVQFATVNWAGTATDATFTAASDTDFARADVFSLVAPAMPDTTLADISFSLIADRI